MRHIKNTAAVLPDQRRVMNTPRWLRHRLTLGRAGPAAVSLLSAAILFLAGCSTEGGRDSAESGPAKAPSTATWTTYTSDQYGFKVGHPPDWKAIPATRDSRVGTDTAGPASAASDNFRSPSDDVRVSVWSVPFDPGSSIESTDDIEAWVEEYCETSGTAPCTGIHDRAVELCLEKWDCHPGLLVPFEHDVQAFFSGGIYDQDAMTIVAVWWGESAPAVAPYGGSQHLLEAFLSTMQVWPASTPRDERECYGRPPSGTDCHAAG